MSTPRIFPSLAVLVIMTFSAKLQAYVTFDSSFGTNGIVSTHIPNATRALSADLIIQADQTSLVGGYSEINGIDYMTLVKYLPNGAVDSSFGNSGIATVLPTGTTGASIAGIGTQTDGRIIAAGSATGGATTDFIVGRYLASGAIDTSFGNNGFVTTDFGGDDICRSVAIVAGGNIVVSGYGGPNQDFVVARYTPGGVLDSTFGTSGITKVNLGFHEFTWHMAIQSDGKILVGGRGGGSADTAVTRFTASGQLDSTFGTGGIFRKDFGSFFEEVKAIAVRPDGKIDLLCQTESIVTLLQLNTNGTLDSTFANLGVASITYPNFSTPPVMNDLLLEPDGSLIICGANFNNGMLMHVLSNGAVDPTFSPDVIASTNMRDDLTALALRPDGRLLAAGETLDAGNFYLVQSGPLSAAPEPGTLLVISLTALRICARRSRGPS